MDDVLGPVLFLCWVAFMFIPAVIARGKGYSFWTFVLFGAFTWIVATFVASVLPDRAEAVTVGQIVRTRDTVKLNDGGTIPSGHVSTVAALDVIDGHVVAQIEAPDGSSRWVARSGVLPA
jgi:hypothetical protein